MHIAGVNVNEIATVENSLAVPQKLNTKLPYDQAIPTPRSIVKG